MIKERKTLSQLAFTFSKSTLKALEKGVRYVQSYQQKHQDGVIDVVLVFLLLTLTIFHSRVFIVDFEQVNVQMVLG